MPVTVKFSRDFYDRFGHEAVDELVNFFNRIDANYRGELKELNEHNFTRLNEKVGELRGDLGQRFAQLDTRFEQLRTEIVAARADTIKWMFLFVATAVLAILGLG